MDSWYWSVQTLLLVCLSNYLLLFSYVDLGLNLYNVLEPDTFNQLSEYVPVINRTAFSTVYDVSIFFLLITILK